MDDIPRLQPARKMRRIKLSDQVAEDLRQWVVRDQMRAGDRLPNEKLLMDHFGCSKGTIREALKALEVEGLIVMQPGPNGGAEIRPATPEAAMQQLRQFLHFKNVDFRHVYELRKSAEVMLAQNIIGKLTEDHFRRLQENVDACVEANARGDRAAGRSVETMFHDILCEACDNPILVFLCQFLNSLLRDLVRFRGGSMQDHDDFGDHNVDSHRELLEAFRSMNREKAVNIMAHHMSCAEDYMLKLDASFMSDMLSRRSLR